MLFRRPILDAIAAGEVTLAFRRWRRPTVRTGGTLRTAAGVLEIREVRPIDASDLSESDARRAGYPTLDALRKDLDRGRGGALYRIELGALHPDPRIALRESADLPEAEANEVLGRLERLDARSTTGPWTRSTLETIAERPARPARDLVEALGIDRERLKRNVRKLKELGLTESLGIGYRLSVRGKVLLERLRSSDGGTS
ncbi:MAG TPA: hypothetical protein RMG48_04980 [Myxococcales bacterium LLY-WYZ-16_1]|nr:hypothetical protein [Myxococcales bacterium LLY-WYZ-16_1]